MKNNTSPSDENFIERVASIADDIVAADQKVTNEAVRQKLGGGSLREISPAVRQWRIRQAVSENSSSIPAAVEEKMSKTLAYVWSAANNQADDEMDALRTLTQTRISEAEAEREEVFDELERVEKKLEKLEIELADAVKEKGALERLAVQAQARAEELAAQNERMQDEITKVREEASKATADAKDARSVASESDAKVRVALSETKAERATREKAELAAEKARAEAVEAREVAAELRGQLKSLKR